MSALSQKDQRRLLLHVEKQGVNVTETKKGYLMRFPNGKTEMLHKSQSDYRGVNNLKASLKRSGITWPFDGEKAELPKYITDSPPRKSTLEKYLTTLEAMGEGRQLEEVTATELARAHWSRLRPEDPFPKNTGTVLSTAFRVLYGLGYKQTAYRKGKFGFVWELPVTEKPAVTQAAPFAPPQMFAPEPEPTEEKPMGELHTLPAPPPDDGREFIDSVESWTLDPAVIAEDSVGSLIRMTQAAGLKFEIRVWRG